MPDKTWKRREREAAALFGCRRQVLSGSSGRDDKSQSDSTHPRLYIETKAYARQAVRSLWREVALKAAKERKVAVLVLYEGGKPGGLIVIHEADLDALVEERMKAVAGEDGETF